MTAVINNEDENKITIKLTKQEKQEQNDKQSVDKRKANSKLIKNEQTYRPLLIKSRENNNNSNNQLSKKMLLTMKEEEKKYDENISNIKGKKEKKEKKEETIESKKEKNQRKFYVDFDNDCYKITQPENFCTNYIRTSQYTLLSFFPLALMNQFKTAFNWYFLFITIIATIPQISNSNPMANLLPFIVVLIISLIKEAVEDLRKYQNDVKANETKVISFQEKKFKYNYCKNIKVGNIIRIKKDELIPADILIIKTSLENGFCYTQTANLDGEDCLKPREAMQILQSKKIKTANDIFTIFSPINDNFYIEVDNPTKNIYEIEGTVFIQKEKHYFTIKNTLLRGARLKNVDYVYGIVIYSGQDTKMMKNINHFSLKISNIDRKLNVIVFFILAVCIIICLIFAILGTTFRTKNLPDYNKNEIRGEYIFYYRKGESQYNFLETVRIFAGNLIIFSYFIPISIMIVNAVIKVLQTIYLELYTPEYRENPGDQIKCYSTSLLEEIGMVKYIFSDKTGTLTQNEMVFKGCSIFGLLFDYCSENNNDIDQDLLNFPQDNMINKTDKTDFTNNQRENNEFKNVNSKISESFNSNTFYKYLIDKNLPLDVLKVKNCPFQSQYEAIKQYFLNIIINHDVLAEKNKETGKMNFQGSNPDEITLVSAADEFGFTFISRENNIITIEIDNHEEEERKTKETYEILQKFDFTSERQRSSIIVKDLSTKKIILYLKGSDRKVFSNLDDYSYENIYPKTKFHADKFAKEGLRTLCYSFKEIKDDEYNNWLKEYDDIKYKSINNKTLTNKLESIIEKIESNAILLGVSALEDKLQDGVKKDIQSFIEAGINFWMITGDKMDTAESIGYSCGIFSEDTEVFKIKETNDAQKVIQIMDDISSKIDKINEELNEITKKHYDKLVEEKVIQKDENYKNYRKRYNSFDGKIMARLYHDDFEFDKNSKIDKINTGKSYNERSPRENNNDNNESLELKINDKNMKIEEEKKQEMEKNIGEKSIISSNNSENERSIFNYVAKNVGENDSKYNDFSLMKRLREDIDNSLDMEENKDQAKENINKNNNDNILKLKNNDSKKNEPEKKQHKDIPTDEQNFKKCFDDCQNELYKCAIKKSSIFCLFKTKYLYPQSQETEYVYKKIQCKFSIIIEGISISTCMNNKEASDLFWYLIQRSRSLICCRSSPSQKSQIVNFIKSKTDSITLSIGDGGNDVNMIKTAHVGVGLFGKEGYQAAYSSDYAISQFKYLKRLLFIDGRFSLMRNSYFIYQYFFKNVLFTITNFWFGVFSCFSGGYFYDDWYNTGFNGFITVVPVAARAVTEQDFDPEFSSHTPKEKKVLKYLFPDIFKESRDSLPFNIVKFIFLFFIAMIFASAMFFIPATTYKIINNGYLGHAFCVWDLSFNSFLTVVVSHLFMVLADTLLYNRLVIIFYFIQLVIDFAFLIIYNSSDAGAGMDDTLFFIIGNINFWLIFFMNLAIICVPFYILRKCEFFFGGFISNVIRQKQFKNFYIEKFYQTKVEQMTRVVRSVAKFKRIYKNSDEYQYDNLADQQMKKIVDEFRNKKRKNTHKATTQRYLRDSRRCDK